MGALCSRGDGGAPAGGSPPSDGTAPAARAWSQSQSPAPPAPPAPPARDPPPAASATATASGPYSARDWQLAHEAAEVPELRAAALAEEWRAPAGAPNAFLMPMLERQARDAELLGRLTAMDDSWKRHLDVVRERHSRLRGIDEDTFQNLVERLEEMRLTVKVQSYNPEEVVANCSADSPSLPSQYDPHVQHLEKQANGGTYPPQASTKTQQ